MSALRTITRHGYVGTFLWTPWRAWTANMIVRPITYLMVFGILHRELELGTTQALVVPLCAYSTVVAVLTCANHSIRNDQFDGTFTLAMATPASPVMLWLTRTGAHLPNGFASAVAAVLFASVAFDVDLSEVDAAVVAAFGAVLASAFALSMLVGVLTRRLDDWVGPVALASGLMLTLSGAVIPRDDLPGFLRAASAVVPLAHANDALRRGFGLEPGSPWGDITAEIAVALAVGVVALTLFSWSLRRARELGTLIVEGT